MAAEFRACRARLGRIGNPAVTDVPLSDMHRFSRTITIPADIPPCRFTPARWSGPTMYTFRLALAVLVVAAFSPTLPAAGLEVYRPRSN